MAKRSRSLSGAFPPNALVNQINNDTNKEVLQEDVIEATDLQKTKFNTNKVLDQPKMTVAEVKEKVMSKYEEKTKKQTVEETHVRTTFLFKKELSKRLDKLAENKKKGFKTLFFNDAIEALLDEMEK
jgi:hypothetical protein